MKMLRENIFPENKNICKIYHFGSKHGDLTLDSPEQYPLTPPIKKHVLETFLEYVSRKNTFIFLFRTCSDDNKKQQRCTMDLLI